MKKIFKIFIVPAVALLFYVAIGLNTFAQSPPENSLNGSVYDCCYSYNTNTCVKSFCERYFCADWVCWPPQTDLN
jgi:hypothetical protein